MDKQLFEELLASVKEGDSIRRSQAKPSRTFEAELALNVKAARQKTGLSQADFARVIQVGKGTLLNWGQGRRSPTGPARALLKALINDPVNVIGALNQ